MGCLWLKFCFPTQLYQAGHLVQLLIRSTVRWLAILLANPKSGSQGSKTGFSRCCQRDLVEPIDSPDEVDCRRSANTM